MKRIFKSFIVAMLAFTLLFSCFACGGKNSPPPEEFSGNYVVMSAGDIEAWKTNWATPKSTAFSWTKGFKIWAYQEISGEYGIYECTAQYKQELSETFVKGTFDQNGETGTFYARTDADWIYYEKMGQWDVDDKNIYDSMFGGMLSVFTNFSFKDWVEYIENDDSTKSMEISIDNANPNAIKLKISWTEEDLSLGTSSLCNFYFILDSDYTIIKCCAEEIGEYPMIIYVFPSDENVVLPDDLLWPDDLADYFQ